MTYYNELVLPDADGVETATELVRFFVGGGDSFVALELAPFEGKPSQWGFVLADIANHIANAEALSGGSAKEETFRAIEEGYRQRLSNGLKIAGRNLTSKHS